MRLFNKLLTLFHLIAASGASSSKDFKQTDKGSKMSLAQYTQNNFSSLPMKRVKGKWRVKR